MNNVQVLLCLSVAWSLPPPEECCRLYRQADAILAKVNEEIAAIESLGGTAAWLNKPYLDQLRSAKRANESRGYMWWYAWCMQSPQVTCDQARATYAHFWLYFMGGGQR